MFSITQYVEYVSEWKSKGLFNENIRAVSTSDNSLNPTLSHCDTKIRVKSAGGCLKQPQISYTHGKVVNIYIVYESGTSSSNVNDTTLQNCLFGAVTLKMQTLINMDILVMEFDLIEEDVFHFQVVGLVKMC